VSDQTGTPPEEPQGGAWPPAAPPYGAPQGTPPGPYGVPYGQGAPAPSDSRDTTIMVLGILGLIFCQLLAPVAWYMGKKRIDEVRAAGQREPGTLKAGYICGIIGSIALLLGFVVVVFAFIVVTAVGTSS
jgi:hypothetical protein